MKDLLKNISKKDLIDFEYQGGAKKDGETRISLANIDFLAKQSYPPCMLSLHGALRGNHHLKHFGRLQYGLFLKGIGLTLEESLHFWKAEFVKGAIDGDKFDKQYAYNIRHSYGKEGKRADYTPWSCKRVINNKPGVGEYHGCPFKTFKEETLTDFLIGSYGLTAEEVTPILNKRRDNQF